MPSIVPTDTGALIACAWDANPYWDPRIIEVDLKGQVLGERVVENTLFPEQTLGVAPVDDAPPKRLGYSGRTQSVRRSCHDTLVSISGRVRHLQRRRTDRRLRGLDAGPMGWRRVFWDGRGSNGRMMPAGAYWLRVKVAEQTTTHSLARLR